MARTTVRGECRICGDYTTLSYEHVPPRCAFNDAPLRSYKLGEWWRLQTEGSAHFQNEQRGAGDHLLCKRCNEHVCGAWYVPELCKWVRAVATRWDELPRDASDVVVTIGLRRVFPARFAKQVLAMLLATSRGGYVARHKPLRHLVLHRDSTGLPDEYQLYLSLFNGDTARATSTYDAFFCGRSFEAIELSYPPFSYMLTIGEGVVEERLGRVSDFLNWRYDQEGEPRLKLPVNWTLLPQDIGTPT
jgi:hypothetical protein